MFQKITQPVINVPFFNSNVIEASNLDYSMHSESNNTKRGHKELAWLTIYIGLDTEWLKIIIQGWGNVMYCLYLLELVIRNKLAATEYLSKGKSSQEQTTVLYADYVVFNIF